MNRYYNEKQNKVYYEGRSLTHQTPGGLFSGIPSEEQLKEWGYEIQEEPAPQEPSEEEKAEQARLLRMSEIQQELQQLDYLTHKEADGEDMAKYDEKYGGDWHAYRRALRAEYNRLEQETAINITDN